MKLNLGCGKDYQKGYINTEINKSLKADVYFSLDDEKYPFQENTFSFVKLQAVLEHLNNPISSLKEVMRICKNKAVIEVFVPHFSSYANYSDVQHKTNYSENSFNDEKLQEYELTNLKLINVEFIYTNKWKKYIPFKNILKIFFLGVYDDILFSFEVKK